MTEKTCRHDDCVAVYAADLARTGRLAAAVDAHLGHEPVPCVEAQLSRITVRPPVWETSNGEK